MFKMSAEDVKEYVNSNSENELRNKRKMIKDLSGIQLIDSSGNELIWKMKKSHS